jgi:hypothetical protein
LRWLASVTTLVNAVLDVPPLLSVTVSVAGSLWSAASSWRAAESSATVMVAVAPAGIVVVAEPSMIARRFSLALAAVADSTRAFVRSSTLVSFPVTSQTDPALAVHSSVAAIPCDSGRSAPSSKIAGATGADTALGEGADEAGDGAGRRGRGETTVGVSRVAVTELAV